MTSIGRVALICMLAFLPALAVAGFFDQSGEEARLAMEISYRPDTGTDSSFEKIVGSTVGWISQRTTPLRYTGEPFRIWARFDLPPSPRQRRVYVVTGPWESVEYFFVRDGKVVDHQWSGTLVPWSERATHVTMVSTTLTGLSGFVAIDTPADAQTTVFARMATDQRFTRLDGLRFSIWDENKVRSEEASERLIDGIFLGIMLLLVAYNLALYLLDVRDASYLYYVVALLCGVALWLSASGLGHEIAWPAHPAWDYYALWIVAPIGVYAFAQFMRRYLDLPLHLPRLDRQFQAVTVLLLGYIWLVELLSRQFSFLRDIQGAVEWMGPAAAGAPALYVCIVALRKRLPSARFFAVAIGCGVIGALASVLPLVAYAAMSMLTMPWSWMIHGHQVGVASMGALLSLGLALRARDLRADLARKQVEEARITAERHQLELASKHKSEFLANMSHELRTPLNAIIGFSDVMLSGMAGPMPEKQKEFTSDIRDSGKHLLGLINDILDLSKIEAGRMELEVAPFDVRAAMDNAMTLVRTRADRHGIRLESAVAPEIAEYRGDERKFKQIMLNLLSNAVKFTPEGGTVTMSAGKSDGSYLFSVKDTGVGIAPEDHQTIFEEFRQVGDTARRAEGTGLGLTLTRKLVELHGGRIRVDSAPGKGSTFTFNLPIGQT